MIPLFIKTYNQDAEWLGYALRSLAKFTTGFGPVVLVTEPESLVTIRDVVARVPGLAGPVVVDAYEHCPEARVLAQGYTRQMYIKMQADHILSRLGLPLDHVQIDSDVVVVCPVTPQSWFGDVARPRWQIQRGLTTHWGKGTQLALGFLPEHEYMCQAGFFVRAAALRGLESFIEQHHQKPLVQFFRTHSPRRKRRPTALPRLGLLSEYELIGAWAHRFAPELYDWQDSPPSVPVVNQGWSWGGLTVERRAWLEALVGSEGSMQTEGSE